MAETLKNGFSVVTLKKLLSQNSEKFSEDFARCIKDSYKMKKIEEIITSRLEPKDLMVVLALLTRIPWSIFNSAKTNILTLLTADEFYDSLIRYVLNNIENNCYNSDEYMALVRFYEILVTYLPICEDTYEKFLTLFEMTYKCLENFVLKSPCEKLLYERLEELVKLLIFKAYYRERNKWHYSYMNIYPSPVDFFENRNLKPNIIQGSYDSTDHYLDLHFKILKEDFVCAVRQGIEQYRSEIFGGKVKRNSLLHLYKNVSSIGISIDKYNLKSKIYHHIIFSDEDKIALQEDNFQVTKKFMTGSLLFFTRNDFTTFVVATVEDNGERNDCVNKQFNGIKVSVIGNPYQLKIGKQYNMIEPVTFFEPYYQSLKTLQTMDPIYFPLKDNIVFANMKPISSGIKFSIADKDKLNPSQIVALEAALSQKFTIIQGPPGTGKSYLARLIINTLIKSRDPANYPILVICVRNNALDLVLEPLVSSNVKIVRLGSQSKSEILTEMTLQKLRKEWMVSCGSKQLLLSKINQYRKIILDPKNVNRPDSIETAVQGYSAASDSLNSLLQYYDARQILSSGVHVIGATTAGAARYRKMLSFIKPRVVIIEEAAEVMEPLIISSIPEKCDHVILIGDHLQLQPTPAWHPSTSKYKMDVSLFERMINNGMEYYQLKEQHRMRPEIASLISPLVYPDLLNHPSVCNYPDVRGMAKNLFFVDHNIREDRIEDDSESHWNFHEADFLLSLANYLVKQDYDPSEITILATYAAQQTYLKQASEDPFYAGMRGVQIQVVDNYQGEENNIILLSLVRSKSPTIGFVARMNRINVAISRAKHGLYIVGNMKTLQSCCDSWKKIINILRSKKSIDNTLPLQCGTHKKITKVSRPQQLFNCIYGGCDLPCGFKLKCGHICPYPCHGSSKLHNEPCLQPCLRYKQCGHKCKDKCFEDCESKPCRHKESFTLSCGHSAVLACSFDFSSYLCIEPCNKLMSCGRHRCQNPCFQECGPWPCMELIEHTFPCGHSESVECSVISFYKCMKECIKICTYCSIEEITGDTIGVPAESTGV
ncbi:unnamed protein product [Nezara viridula]|uniref:NFX1-type zinc finger-containing protein 1 n=1 Tax=Nezara viridula TaxID=85310 RepID=A0A9P0HR49_NEZVI|nr:unnamed protein product [Nezara viridula]